MSPTLLLVAALLVPGPGPVRAASPPPGAVRAPSAPRSDTLLIRDLSRIRRPGGRPVRPGDTPLAVLGLRPFYQLGDGPWFPRSTLTTRPRWRWGASRAPRVTVGDPAAPPLTFAARASADLRARRIRELAGASRARAVRAGVLPAPGPPSAGAPEGEPVLPDAIAAYTDLGVRARTRAELGGDWVRFRPCTDRFQEACQPSLVPQLQPDLNFALQVEGTVLDRIRVDVDYDRLREFGGTNTLSLEYRGGGDDILQRVAVGDVTFPLPRSRFVTEGVPAGNFGFQLQGQLGPVDFNSVFAQQRGDVSSREFRLEGVGQDRRFVQSDTLVLDDADYARGQFFFLVDPEEILDYPHVDILAVDAGSAPADVVPGIQPVQVYRFDNNPAARQQVEGYIQADAVATDDFGQVSEAGWFRFLVPGQDYFVHPSGLWLALRTPLSRDEMLAVTYITAVGDTVGDYNPEDIYNQGGRPELRLLKATDPNHQPGRPTWDLEMRQLYRVSTSPDVEQASVEVTISLGELSAGRTFKRAPSGRDITYLQLFGVDQESPLDRVDPVRVYNPAAELFQDPPVVSGTFVVFPTLRPFSEPPPVPGLGLSADDTRTLLGEDANERIYDAEDPFDRRNGGRFRLNIPFRVRSEGVISTFSLGALGVLERSERIRLGERLLIRGVDYDVDYDAGLVTLLDADALFATTPDAVVRATWEQQQIFRTAPTSVVGFNAHTGNRERGSFDFVALYQQEETLINRPVLGLEPGSVFLTGVSGGVDRDVPWLDGLLDAVPGLRLGQASTFSFDGEVALSLPRPNTQGAVFVDDFDAAQGRPLSLLARDWRLGSAAAERTGAEEVLPQLLGADEQARMTWQHTWIIEDPQGDSVGIFEGYLAREDIDRQIRVAGSQVREAGLRLTVDVPFAGQPYWSAITAVLSPTGTDLTRSEFLEFYAAGDDGTLVLDLGTVSEDVLFVDDQGLTSGIKENGVPWGVGLLDQEADPARGQVWGNALDALGVWGESCLDEPGRIYRLGDPRANCTRGNGREDSEDLDRDGNLDTTERSLRYVVPLDGNSPFLVRSRAETGSDFRLFRIPIRAGGVEVNGPFTEADLRAIRHLRLTVVSRGDTEVTLARMRIVGSRWIRRTGQGALTGIVGDTAALAGRAEVSPVSRITDGDFYASPPGVLEQLADPTTAVGARGLEFNERSLAIRVENLQPGDRGEVFSRFPQRPRNFLTYREARLWVLPRLGRWGEEEAVRFFFKIGSDPDNFYLFRTPLRPAVRGPVSPGDWLPEVVVDFDAFLALRVEAEEELILNPPGPGDPPIQVWSADSTYSVTLRDRGRAPDLANVRELSLGIWNQGTAPFDGEVWVNELRLARGDRDPGLAGLVTANLNAGDVVRANVTVSSRDGTFRQLRETPTYRTDRRMTVDARARLDRFAPSGWGVEIPLSFSMDRSGIDPQFLNRSDVRADLLPDLREVGTRRSQLSLGFRKVTPSENPLVGLVLDGLEASVAAYRVRDATVTSRVESQGVDARVGYNRRLEPREIDPVPGFLEGVARLLLPAGVEDAVLGSRIRWTPARFSIGTAYLRRDDDIFRFRRIITTGTDEDVIPTRTPREALELAGELVLQPLETLTLRADFRSLRDLLRPGEAVANPDVQALIAEERSRLAGLDLGWETDRTLATRVRYRPRFWSWLQHEVGWSSRYSSQRNALFLGVEVAAPGDTTRVLQRNLRAERSLAGRVSLDPGQVARAAWGADADGLVSTILRTLRPLSWQATDGITSRFNRAAVDPGLGYQLGWRGAFGFRVLPGDTANTLTDGLSQRVAWGAGGEAASLDVSWAQSELVALDARADRDIFSRTWPDLRGRIADAGPLAALAPGLDRVALSLGYAESERVSRVGAAGEQTRRNDEVQLPWDVTLSWVGSVVTSYRGSVLRGDGRDPTGETERERVSHRVSFTSSFLPPFGLSGTEPQPVQLSLIGSWAAERECRVPRSRSDCVPFIDQINRALSMTMDTRVSDFQVGLQASFTDRRSFIGRRQGSTQFQLGLFGQFILEAGRFARPAGFGQ